MEILPHTEIEEVTLNYQFGAFICKMRLTVIPTLHVYHRSCEVLYEYQPLLLSLHFKMLIAYPIFDSPYWRKKKGRQNFKTKTQTFITRYKAKSHIPMHLS